MLLFCMCRNHTHSCIALHVCKSCAEQQIVRMHGIHKYDYKSRGLLLTYTYTLHIVSHLTACMQIKAMNTLLCMFKFSSELNVTTVVRLAGALAEVMLTIEVLASQTYLIVSHMIPK